MLNGTTQEVDKWFIINDCAKRTALEKEVLASLAEGTAVDKEEVLYSVCGRIITDFDNVSTVVSCLTTAVIIDEFLERTDCEKLSEKLANASTNRSVTIG